MVKKRLLCLAVLLVLALSGCAHFESASAGMIIPPQAKSPLGGKWTVQKALDAASAEESAALLWEDRSVQFSGNSAAFGGQLWDNLSYKIKRVEAGTYCNAKGLPISEVSVSETALLDIVTLYAADNYLGELMKIDSESMVFFVQNSNLLLQKISDQADDRLQETYAKAQDPADDGGGNASGLLLGLRAPAGDDYRYRTLWISTDGNELHPVLVSENLFFPRTSGFWECKSTDASVDGIPGNLLTAGSAFIKDPVPEEAETETSPPALSESALHVVHFIGNDYASIERIARGTSQLEIVPVDTLSTPTMVRAIDLLGEKGLLIYGNARKEALQTLRREGIAVSEEAALSENFGLLRGKGHWKMTGRLHYGTEGSAAHADFEFKVVPPYNMVFYDALTLNWNHIKDRVPDALDAFTSPDRSIAIVKTKNKLTVYAIGTEKLSENALGEIALDDGETVVMAEWATTIYVDPWERAFLAYGARPLL